MLTRSSVRAMGLCSAVSRSNIPFRSFLTPTANPSVKNILSRHAMYWHLTDPERHAAKKQMEKHEHYECDTDIPLSDHVV